MFRIDSRASLIAIYGSLCSRVISNGRLSIQIQVQLTGKKYDEATGVR